MFNGSYSKVNSPCMGCAKRCVDCHSQCKLYSEFREAKANEEYERVRSREGLGGVVLRQHAILG